MDNFPCFRFACLRGNWMGARDKPFRAASWTHILNCNVSLILIYILVFPYCLVPEKLFSECACHFRSLHFFRLNMFSVFLGPGTAIYIVWIVCLLRSHSLGCCQLFAGLQINRLVYKLIYKVFYLKSPLWDKSIFFRCCCCFFCNS